MLRTTLITIAAICLFGQARAQSPQGVTVIPGTASEASVLFGTLQIRCRDSGICGYIFTSKNIAQIPQPDGTTHEYSYERYENVPDEDGSILLLYGARRTN